MPYRNIENTTKMKNIIKGRKKIKEFFHLTVQNERLEAIRKVMPEDGMV